MIRRLVPTLAYLVATAAVAGGVWWASLGDALEAAAAKGRSDLSLAADRLVLELQRSRDLAVLLSADPRIEAMLAAPTRGATGLLQGIADRSGASGIAVLRRDGAVAAATPEAPATAEPWLARARTGALGYGTDPRTRVFTHVAPVFAGTGRVTGAVAVSRALADIERGWRSEPRAIYYVDGAGRILASNRLELLEAPPSARLTPVRGFDVQRLEAPGPYLPATALHLEMPVPTLGLTAELLLDVAPARALATARAWAVAAALLVLGAALLSLWERRRVLATANAQLEARVTQRTAALSEANARLEGEVRERREAEAALTRAQAELVQAGKLGALGQMSAGISHELNQPLMAIRSFAQNAGTFLDRGDAERAAYNLARIGDLARRMGRIIANLRAFARAEPEPAVIVDLQDVVEAGLEITQGRRCEVETVVVRPDGPVRAMGGEVRLGQVLVNLIANALDAMAGHEGAVLTLVLEDGPPRLTVRDTGPGLSQPERLFDPFYTTKEVGKGLGLGLSLSYGIVSGFGGTVRARDTGAGAEFEVVLIAPEAVEAAA